MSNKHYASPPPTGTAPKLLYIRNKDGKTPLDVAKKNKKDDVVEILSAAMKTGYAIS